MKKQKLTSRNRLLEKITKSAFRYFCHESECQFSSIQKIDGTVEHLKTSEKLNFQELLTREFNFVKIKSYTGDHEYLNMNLVKSFQLVTFPDFEESFLYIYPVGTKRKVILEPDSYYILAERFPEKTRKQLIKR